MPTTAAAFSWRVVVLKSVRFAGAYVQCTLAAACFAAIKLAACKTLVLARLVEAEARTIALGY